jgi:ubiquinone/menaquinone biosynthesis C-methylase UbiE
MPDTYSHGHHESVLRSHIWRTAANSAEYLLGDLEPGERLLDVGCGPGTVTLDVASHVAPGLVVGLDAAVDVVRQAERRRFETSAANVAFAVGDTYALPFGDGTFDVAHAHQVLQHLSEPDGALAELRRVLRPGGLLAVRDGDYGGFVWAPPEPLLDRWLDLYHQLTAHNRTHADAGRYLLDWVQAAGFRDIKPSSSTWTFADPESRAWWGDLWADRVQFSSFAEQTVAYGLSNAEELGAIAQAWRRWAREPAGWFAVLHGEVLARR